MLHCTSFTKAIDLFQRNKIFELACKPIGYAGTHNIFGRAHSNHPINLWELENTFKHDCLI